jgi:hypothetical protein
MCHTLILLTYLILPLHRVRMQAGRFAAAHPASAQPARSIVGVRGGPHTAACFLWLCGCRFPRGSPLLSLALSPSKIQSTSLFLRMIQSTSLRSHFTSILCTCWWLQLATCAVLQRRQQCWWDEIERRRTSAPTGHDHELCSLNRAHADQEIIKFVSDVLSISCHICLRNQSSWVPWIVCYEFESIMSPVQAWTQGMQWPFFYNNQYITLCSHLT